LIIEIPKLFLSEIKQRKSNKFIIKTAKYQIMATLGYWGFRGLAQPIRFLLAYLGVEYTEK